MEPLLLVDRAVLAALAHQGPATGRGIAGLLGVRVPVYPVLRRLEYERLVSSGPIPGSTRRTRLYRLTGRGVETLEALGLWLRTVHVQTDTKPHRTQAAPLRSGCDNAATPIEGSQLRDP
jgi:DNA-binding MarR family transcriptional regulator